jgi:hypothetical protein
MTLGEPSESRATNIFLSIRLQNYYVPNSQPSAIAGSPSWNALLLLDLLHALSCQEAKLDHISPRTPTYRCTLNQSSVARPRYTQGRSSLP